MVTPGHLAAAPQTPVQGKVSCRGDHNRKGGGCRAGVPNCTQGEPFRCQFHFAPLQCSQRQPPGTGVACMRLVVACLQTSGGEMQGCTCACSWLLGGGRNKETCALVCQSQQLYASATAAKESFSRACRGPDSNPPVCLPHPTRPACTQSPKHTVPAAVRVGQHYRKQLHGVGSGQICTILADTICNVMLAATVVPPTGVYAAAQVVIGCPCCKAAHLCQ